MSTTRITLVAATFTDITSQFEALGNQVKLLTPLTDVSVGFVLAGQTPTALKSITGGDNGPAVIMNKPEGSPDKVWAYSTGGGNIYLHGNTEHVEYIDKDFGGVVAGPLTGTGISSVAAASVKEFIARHGNLIETTLIIDIQGLDSSAGTDDIIGKDSTANCWFYQVKAARNGTIFGGSIECIETPATGDTDVDLYATDESTGVEDAAVSGMTQTLLANGASLALGEGPDALALVPSADQYIYLTGAGSTNATYSAGKFLIKFWGLAA